jgi:hypothetical protein
LEPLEIVRDYKNPWEQKTEIFEDVAEPVGERRS